jgi:NCAIR mutase (PurE)-related protein
MNIQDELKIVARLQAYVMAKTKIREAAEAITQDLQRENGLPIPEIILATCDPLGANKNWSIFFKQKNNNFFEPIKDERLPFVFQKAAKEVYDVTGKPLSEVVLAKNKIKDYGWFVSLRAGSKPLPMSEHCYVPNIKKFIFLKNEEYMLKEAA